MKYTRLQILCFLFILIIYLFANLFNMVFAKTLNAKVLVTGKLIQPTCFIDMNQTVDLGTYSTLDLANFSDYVDYSKYNGFSIKVNNCGSAYNRLIVGLGIPHGWTGYRLSRGIGTSHPYIDFRLVVSGISGMKFNADPTRPIGQIADGKNVIGNVGLNSFLMSFGVLDKNNAYVSFSVIPIIDATIYARSGVRGYSGKITASIPVIIKYR